MRLRRFFARLVPGAVAVGVLAAGATVGYAQNRGVNGSIEVVDVASTAPVTNAIQQLAQLIPSGYDSNAGPHVAASVVGGAQSPTTTGDAGLIASVVQSSDVILDLPAGAADNANSTNKRGMGMYLVLAQFN